MSFPVSQVHNVGSHTGNDSWAWDFRMPEGTPVVAALDGVVRLARGDSDEGGCDPAMARKANYVVIESAGALETQYLHFSAVRVAPGQHVRRGELLGYSGKTGWACGAHLHFKVATPVSAGWNNPSVEARLQGYGDPSLEAWVSSPPCTAPLEVASPQPAPAVRQGDLGARSAGDVQPAALSAAGSAGQAAISVSLPPPLETQPTAAGSSSSPPLQQPLSTGGAPFPPPMPPAPVAGPLGPELQATSPAPAHALARTPPPPSPAAVGQGDTEAELLGAAGSAPARR
ncbi:MAG TPA: M23 family metallopeptidase [Myxococcaceae bacterium]|nr:M23 family metallopeptidase [Myxococcaceae bacterium]